MESSSEGDYHQWWLHLLANVQFISPSQGVIVALTGFILLILCSALVSGSEVAYFSISGSDIKDLRDNGDRKSKRILKLLMDPSRLLATILIANNFINVAIIILSYYIMENSFDFGDNSVISFLINVIGVTIILVLFGEVMPKIYATQGKLKMAATMSLPLQLSVQAFYPLSSILIKSSNMIEKRLASSEDREEIDMEEIRQAIDISVDEETSKQEIKILKGIIQFGNITVKQISRARVDVVAIQEDTGYHELLALVRESGYSRIPVYSDNLDNIMGILYSKDLLGHLEDADSFHWQHLVRPAFFVPETKKIDDLLKEFQSNRMHLAVVVDEYGGTSGIITLEDILEEVIGEIRDEYDEEEDVDYTKTPDGSYIFEGKVLLHDFMKALNIPGESFDQVKGDADSLGGLILEIGGKFPTNGEKILYKEYLFSVLSVDNNRIGQVKVKIDENYDEDDPEGN